jgi:hypothetical protein
LGCAHWELVRVGTNVLSLPGLNAGASRTILVIFEEGIVFDLRLAQIPTHIVHKEGELDERPEETSSKEQA